MCLFDLIADDVDGVDDFLVDGGEGDLVLELEKDGTEFGAFEDDAQEAVGLCVIFVAFPGEAFDAVEGGDFDGELFLGV